MQPPPPSRGRWGPSSPGTPVLLQLCFFKGRFGPLPQEEHCNWFQRSPSHPGTAFTPVLSANLVGSTKEGLTQPRRQQSQRRLRLSPSTHGLHDPSAVCPDLLLNSVGAEAAQHPKVPTLHLQHGEMRSRRVGPDVISTPSSWLVCSLVPEAPAACDRVGGTALVLSFMAPGQSLAASPKLFFPSGCQALY